MHKGGIILLTVQLSQRTIVLECGKEVPCGGYLWSYLYRDQVFSDGTVKVTGSQRAGHTGTETSSTHKAAEHVASKRCWEPNAQQN